MKMKYLFTVLFSVLLISNTVFAQDDAKKKDSYKFEVKKQLKATSVKNQYRSGTCWSFSGLSFIESELIREGKGEFDLSEMFVVRHSYIDKAEKYVRFHGHLNFGGGGAFHDVTDVIKKYGIVPEEVYGGLIYGTEKHVHGELDAVLKGYMDQVLENKNRVLTQNWKIGFEGILDAYLGKAPEKFTYNGKEYTPKSFANDYLEIDTDKYIEVSSYTHHPFYSEFIIEVPDNWAYDEVYNVKLNELEEIIDKSIEKGYTVGWAADVSEKGFSWKNGVAIVPEKSVENMDDTEKAKWSELSKKDKQKMLYSFDGPTNEKKINQEIRQEAFDNFTTTDDHGMHITGIAYDQAGNKFYIIKNSWSADNHIYDGYFYASKAFVLYKTMDIMINKNILPKDIAKKLDL